MHLSVFLRRQVLQAQRPQSSSKPYFGLLRGLQYHSVHIISYPSHPCMSRRRRGVHVTKAFSLNVSAHTLVCCPVRKEGSLENRGHFMCEASENED